MKPKALVANAYLLLILATPIPSNPIPNFVCWGLSRNSNFFIKRSTWATHVIDIKYFPL